MASRANRKWQSHNTLPGGSRHARTTRQVDRRCGAAWDRGVRIDRKSKHAHARRLEPAGAGPGLLTVRQAVTVRTWQRTSPRYRNRYRRLQGPGLRSLLRLYRDSQVRFLN
ncbi:uncharacterized protein LOC114254376 [Monomorium pharaonis]|uniref:uncharacterized protein LOC114254376 n=1 Tax=Monomorium pharaonis TaxID=307658 RepID=UPI001747A045|nr:uncharacterized protein LOC114254376 [Monomorium pharaonis]